MKKLLKIVVSLLLTLGVGAPGIVLAEDYTGYFKIQDWDEDCQLYFVAEITDSYETISSKKVGDTVNLKVYKYSEYENLHNSFEDEDYDADVFNEELNKLSYITYTGTITSIDYEMESCVDDESYFVTYTVSYDKYSDVSTDRVYNEGTATGVHSACYGDFKEQYIAEGYDETDWEAINCYVDFTTKDDEGNYTVYIFCAWCSELLATTTTTKVENTTLTSDGYTYNIGVYYFTYNGVEYTEEYELGATLSKNISLSSLNLGTVTDATVSDKASFTVSVNSDGELAVVMNSDAVSGTYTEDVTLTLEDGSTKVITLTVVYDESEGTMDVTYVESKDSKNESGSTESTDSNASASSDSVETADTNIILVYSVLGLAALAGVIYIDKKEYIL